MSRKEEIEEMKKKRFRYLCACYEESGADQYKVLRTYTMAGDRAFEHKLTDKIVRYLEQEELVEVSGRGDQICITHKGIREVEQALSKPDVPTEHFPAGFAIYAGHITHSQIQQASPGATQASFEERKYEQLEEVIQLLKDSIEQVVDELALEAQERSDLEAQIRTIEAQMSSPHPRARSISESLRSVRAIVEGAIGGAAGSLLAQTLLRKIANLLGG